MPEHVEAIKTHGPCPVHRRTFAPTRLWFPLEEAKGKGKEGPKQKKVNSRWLPGGDGKKGKAKK